MWICISIRPAHCDCLGECNDVERPRTGLTPGATDGACSYPSRARTHIPTHARTHTHTKNARILHILPFSWAAWWRKLPTGAIPRLQRPDQTTVQLAPERDTWTSMPWGWVHLRSRCMCPRMLLNAAKAKRRSARKGEIFPEEPRRAGRRRRHGRVA